MMTRLVLFRTFIALCVCAGTVAGGIILWSLAPVIDEVRQPATTVAAATTSLDALPERLPPVRLDPPGEGDAGWRLSNLPYPDLPPPFSDVTGALDDSRPGAGRAPVPPVTQPSRPPSPVRPAEEMVAQAAPVVQPSSSAPSSSQPASTVRVIPLNRIGDEASPPVAAARPASPAPVAPPPPAASPGFVSIAPSGASVPTAAPSREERSEASPPVSPRADPPQTEPATARPAAPAAPPAERPAVVARVEPERTDDRVDLNTGTLEDLNSLKGGGRIGRAIIQGRPYRSVEDLLRKKVLTRSTYERIRDQVTVR